MIHFPMNLNPIILVAEKENGRPVGQSAPRESPSHQEDRNRGASAEGTHGQATPSSAVPKADPWEAGQAKGELADGKEAKTHYGRGEGNQEEAKNRATTKGSGRRVMTMCDVKWERKSWYANLNLLTFYGDEYIDILW